ncbi:acetylornithine/N-succinyldiaminopimelate aminotransferase [Monaibacterium marinum]|uniref:Acetylornithine aminotransferase n=1 Tax=Pontivivens marinum TaxID=1690039 RepID=A0A2C9CNX6_9RHOB|nr:aspartate aminotransferase family protein [Monaibacterium marinum]SOH92907.1 acetylornithine/N-succinyldiaminopimelate aminotransferase [Monaibacterium marinum]
MITPVLPTYARAPLSFVEGEGPWLKTEDGTRYLDMGAGIAVASLGHAHPRLVEALETQARRLWHTSNLYEIPNQTRLAEMLIESSFADTVFFTNSGTEATEAAVKMARKYHSVKETGRFEIITFNGSFHGRTLGMISAAGAEKLTKGFGPLLPGFVHVDYGDDAALHAAINERTAAIMVEPVQGEGGIVPIPDEALRALRTLCDEQGILLIYDEIQCGMGRTGKLFAHEWSGATPDIMAVAKGIGGGFPLGACLATEEAASGMVAGTHGTTYGGNPLACAVGCAVMEVMGEDGFLENVSRVAGHMRQGLDSLVARYPDVFELVRGSGLMIGVKCVVPNMDVVNAGYDHKLLTVPGGDNVIRILPPLNITTDDVDEALRRLEGAAADISGRAA